MLQKKQRLLLKMQTIQFPATKSLLIDESNQGKGLGSALVKGKLITDKNQR